MSCSIGNTSTVAKPASWPYARSVAGRMTVHVDGRTFAGTVRTIRSEAGFTPYYALTGDDATRLTYLAEIQLDAVAARLPAGLPVYVDLPR